MSFQVETERLLIRDIQKEDIPILVSQCAEPISRENILSFQSDETYNRKNFENAIAWAKAPRRLYYTLAVTLKSDNTLIGSCNINNVFPESIETIIGWHYGHEFRGNGYATETARQLLYIGFELNEVTSIYADCFVNNKASIRIFEKIGMSPHLNFGLFNLIRGLSYGENKPTVRYYISRNQWLDTMNDTDL